MTDSSHKRQRQQSVGVVGTEHRTMIVNELLCYAQRKYRQLPASTLKQVLFDFYSADMVTESKDELISSIDNLNITDWPKPANRRRVNSKEAAGAKMRQEIEDIYGMLNYIDQNQLFLKLPMFVAANPDHLPSRNLTEGDLQCVIMKLNAISLKVELLDEAVHVNNHTVAGLAATIASTPTAAAAAVTAATTASISSALIAERRNTSDEATNNVNQPRLADDDWESDPNVKTVSRRKENKAGTDRQVSQNAPMNYSRAVTGSTAVNPSTTDQGPSSSQTNQGGHPLGAKPAASKQRPNKMLIIGQSSTAPMKAAKQLNLPKSVYSVRNIDAGHTADNLQDYVESLGVRVVSCYDRTSMTSRYSDNKTFRICVFDADKDKLLCANNWPVGVSIQRWTFKPKGTEDSGPTARSGPGSGGVNRADGATDGEVRSGGTGDKEGEGAGGESHPDVRMGDVGDSMEAGNN